MKKQQWLLYALITTLFWGVWGAFIEITQKAGFPATLSYIVWSFTMIPCSLIALYLIKWQLEYKITSILYGSIIGFLGAGGQLVLFYAVKDGPAFLVFPIISLSPTVTVLLSILFLNEKVSKKQKIGIIIALISIALMSFQEPGSKVQNGLNWLFLSVIVFFSWGIQAFFMKLASNSMKAESIFFYMMFTGILLSPVAYYMTDFAQPVNWGFKGFYLTLIIMTFNSIGALTLLYAIRYGKVIIVAPLTNAVAPLITIIISLTIHAFLPNQIILTGMIIALISVYLITNLN